MAGFNLHGIGLGQSAIVGVLGDTADTVAAHFTFGAVGVEHAHPHVGFGAGKDENEPVATDAKMPVGDFLSGDGGVGHGFGEAVDVDVVVAEPVHFGELHEGDSIQNPGKFHRRVACAFNIDRFSCVRSGTSDK